MDDNDFLTLHCLTLKQLGTPEAIESIVGLPAADAEAALAGLVASGDVRDAKGRYVILPSGRERLDGLYPEVFAAARASEPLAGAYRRFEQVNVDLKSLITDWQTMTIDGNIVPNDHSDPGYDGKLIDRLSELHDRAEPVLRALAAEVARLDRYRERLEAALDRVDTGEIDYVSGVRVDSYHTVWFELHEDLLRILGTTRDE